MNNTRLKRAKTNMKNAMKDIPEYELPSIATELFSSFSPDTLDNIVYSLKNSGVKKMNVIDKDDFKCKTKIIEQDCKKRLQEFVPEKLNEFYLRHVKYFCSVFDSKRTAIFEIYFDYENQSHNDPYFIQLTKVQCNCSLNRSNCCPDEYEICIGMEYLKTIVSCPIVDDNESRYIKKVLSQTAKDFKSYFIENCIENYSLLFDHNFVEFGLWILQNKEQIINTTMKLHEEHF